MNCKPGVLAYITSAYVDKAAVGHVVQIVRLHHGDEFVDGVLYATCSNSWLCRGNVPDSYEKRTLKLVVIGDAYLRPINDPDVDLTIESDKALDAALAMGDATWI